MGYKDTIFGKKDIDVYVKTLDLILLEKRQMMERMDGKVNDQTKETNKARTKHSNALETLSNDVYQLRQFLNLQSDLLAKPIENKMDRVITPVKKVLPKNF